MDQEEERSSFIKGKRSGEKWIRRKVDWEVRGLEESYLRRRDRKQK